MVFVEPNINHDLQTLMQTNVIESYFHPRLSTVQKQNKLFRGWVWKLRVHIWAAPTLPISDIQMAFIR